jgi:hypothetical protein
VHLISTPRIAERADQQSDIHAYRMGDASRDRPAPCRPRQRVLQNADLLIYDSGNTI